MSPCIDGAGDVRKQVGDEFREWPGLQLTVAQASRLWHTDRATIQRVLDELVKEAVLWRHDAVYARRGSDWTVPIF